VYYKNERYMNTLTFTFFTKSQGWKMQDPTNTDQMTGMDNARPDNDGPIIGSSQPPTLSLIRGCHGDGVGSRSCE